MLGCAGNEFMAGFHKSDNKIACCPAALFGDLNNISEMRLFVDGNDELPHQSPEPFQLKYGGWLDPHCSGYANAHVCPSYAMMYGLNINRNYFMCAF